MKKWGVLDVALCIAAIAVVWLVRGWRESLPLQLVQEAPVAAPMARHTGIELPAEGATQIVSGGDSVAHSKGAEKEDAESDVTMQTEEEKCEAEIEKRVNDFDDLTDKWMEGSRSVTMTDVETFAATFRRVPKVRQDECIHRALNLIPDENVMLLAGVLMDKTMDKEIVETVYNDILNRDEDVKKPILQEIFKDKSHPCWADTAWILDVTGELPKSK